MKRLLRRAACVAAILMLIVCPVKALAANIALTGAGAGNSQQTLHHGDTTVRIGQSETYWYVYLKVIDADTVDGTGFPWQGTYAPVQGAEVTLRGTGLTTNDIVQIGKGDDISEVPNPDHKTDAEGEIQFRLPKAMVGSGGFVLQVGLVPPTGMGYEDYKGDNNSGWKDIPLTARDTYRTNHTDALQLQPKHLDVSFENGAKGTVYEPDGLTPWTGAAAIRWGKTLVESDKMPLVKPESDEWAHVGWEITYIDDPAGESGLHDGQFLSNTQLENLKITCPLTFEAQYKRAYRVTYEAGDYGYLSGDPQFQKADGSFEERVVENEKPKHVPTPVPMTEREYRFVKWRFNKLFSYDSVDPASVTITGDTAFLAEFDVRKRQPVIVPTAPAGANPSAPADQSSAALPVIGGIGGGPGGGKGGGGYGGGAEVPSSRETQPAGQSGTLPQSPPEETEQESSGTVPASPASGQMGSETSSWTWNWLILLCCLLTLATGALRIVVIRRTIKGFADPRDGELEKEKVRAGGPKPLVTETIVGIICLILGGYFYASRSSRWELAALILWGATLAVVAVLLFRAERSLRRAAEEIKDNKDKD